MKQTPKNILKNNGQIMIVVVLALGGIMIGASVVGGILMTGQLRQIKNISDSAKAIYAADAGLNFGYYKYLGKNKAQAPNFSNQASSTLLCLNISKQTVPCNSGFVAYIVSRGTAGRVSRALQFSF